MVNNVDNPCNFLRIGLTLAREQEIYFLRKLKLLETNESTLY